jgi:two-component system phosphate regulon sensor histidine kinase PhoR
MRLSAFWTIYAACALAAIAIAFATGAWVSGEVERELEKTHTQRLTALCASLIDPSADLLRATRSAATPDGPWMRWPQRISDRVTVMAADGVVVFDSEVPVHTLENHGARPEMQQALSQGAGASRKELASADALQLYIARLVVDQDGRALGVVRVGSQMTLSGGPSARARHAILAVTLATLAAMLLFGYALARRFREPLAATADMAEAIARGDYRRASAPKGAPEIGRLSEAIATMTAQLEHRLEMMTVDRNKVLAILSSMVEGVVAVDQNERVVHINTVASKLLDADPASAVGRRIWEVTRIPAIQELLDRTRERGEPCSAECTLAAEPSNPGGAVIEMRAAPLRDGSGAVLVLNDVTAFRKLESIRRDFVANVSHELKTPLTAIRALVETMIDDREMPEATVRRFLDKIRDQSLRLTTLVSDLLTLARIESHVVTPERRTLDARAIVRECATRVGAVCEKKQITLSVEIPAEPVLANADEESLRQIVDNLLDNACKYTSSGGAVWVRLERQAQALELTVRDTGIGIDPRDCERVFERFYRVDKARSRELGGTGLGLSIVKHLVQALGGQVGLQSELGRGSTFHVRLPLAGLDSPSAAA